MGKLISFCPQTKSIKSTKPIYLCEKEKYNLISYGHFGVPICKWRGYTFFLVFAIIESKGEGALSTFVLSTISKRKLILAGFTMYHPANSMNYENPPFAKHSVGSSSVVQWESSDGHDIFKHFTIGKKQQTSSSGIKRLKFK